MIDLANQGVVKAKFDTALHDMFPTPQHTEFLLSQRHGPRLHFSYAMNESDFVRMVLLRLDDNELEAKPVAKVGNACLLGSFSQRLTTCRRKRSLSRRDRGQY